MSGKKMGKILLTSSQSTDWCGQCQTTPFICCFRLLLNTILENLNLQRAEKQLQPSLTLFICTCAFLVWNSSSEEGLPSICVPLCLKCHRTQSAFPCSGGNRPQTSANCRLIDAQSTQARRCCRARFTSTVDTPHRVQARHRSGTQRVSMRAVTVLTHTNQDPRTTQEIINLSDRMCWPNGWFVWVCAEDFKSAVQSHDRQMTCVLLHILDLWGNKPVNKLETTAHCYPRSKDEEPRL